MRNHKIDLLRCIGLLMVILAHAGPPNILFQLRNFDVPLLVLVSGMSYGLSYKGESYRQYVWKRIKRLVLPVWIFLTIYYIFTYMLVGSSSALTFSSIISSYLMVGGIGYFWIIRVFVLVALAAPFLYLFNKTNESDKRYLFKLSCAFLIFEICRYFSMPYISGFFIERLSLIVYYIIPYSLLFAFGLRLRQFPVRTNYRLFFFFLSLFVIMVLTLRIITGDLVSTQQYKYPPSIYYISYALTCSLFLWIFIDRLWKIVDKNKAIKSAILFIGRNSIWIYLWHIPLIKTIHADFALKFLVVLLIATSLTYFQVLIVNSLITWRIKSDRFKRNIQMVLTG